MTKKPHACCVWVFAQNVLCHVWHNVDMAVWCAHSVLFWTYLVHVTTSFMSGHGLHLFSLVQWSVVFIWCLWWIPRVWSSCGVYGEYVYNEYPECGLHVVSMVNMSMVNMSIVNTQSVVFMWCLWWICLWWISRVWFEHRHELLWQEPSVNYSAEVKSVTQYNIQLIYVP